MPNFDGSTHIQDAKYNKNVEDATKIDKKTLIITILATILAVALAAFAIHLIIDAYIDINKLIIAYKYGYIY